MGRVPRIMIKIILGVVALVVFLGRLAQTLLPRVCASPNQVPYPTHPSCGGRHPQPRWQRPSNGSRRQSAWDNHLVCRAPVARRGGNDIKTDVVCAGINRQEAEDENSSRERSSDPLGPEFCAVRREVRSEA